MNPYALSHVSDGALLRGLTALVAQERTTTATLLAHLAEVDSRRLYLPATYPSMYAYCVGIWACPKMPRTSASRQRGWRGSFRSCLRPWRTAGCT